MKDLKIWSHLVKEQLTTPIFDSQENVKEYKCAKAIEVAYLVAERTILVNLRTYPRIKQYYLYREEWGYFVSISVGEVEMIIHEIMFMAKTGKPSMEAMSFAREILGNLNLLKGIAEFGDPIFRTDLVVFNNGVLNLKTLELSAHSRKYFLTSKLDFEYNPENECPKFLTFINEFCEGHGDRIQLIRSYLNAVVHSKKSFSSFPVYIGSRRYW